MKDLARRNTHVKYETQNLIYNIPDKAIYKISVEHLYLMPRIVWKTSSRAARGLKISTEFLGEVKK
jgi:hypothetical protein